METPYQRRIRLLKEVPNTLRSSQMERIREYFKNECPLTGDYSTISEDHFVPLSWGAVVKDFGIGGTSYANIILLKRSLNASKSDKNPFEWFERYGERHGVSPDRWAALVDYVAQRHNMSTDEYISCVNACYSEVLTTRWMELINSITLKGSYIKPILMAQALRRNIKISDAIERFGTDRTKRVFQSKRNMLALAEQQQIILENTSRKYNQI